MLKVSAQRIAIAIRTPAVVVRGRETDCGAIRRRLRASGVVRQESETQRATSIGTAFGNERRAGLSGEGRLLTQVDHATKGIGAIERRGRPTEDFHGGQTKDAVAPNLIGIGKALRKATAIQEHRRLGGVRTTEEE